MVICLTQIGQLKNTEVHLINAVKSQERRKQSLQVKLDNNLEATEKDIVGKFVMNKKWRT